MHCRRNRHRALLAHTEHAPTVTGPLNASIPQAHTHTQTQGAIVYPGTPSALYTQPSHTHTHTHTHTHVQPHAQEHACCYSDRVEPQYKQTPPLTTAAAHTQVPGHRPGTELRAETQTASGPLTCTAHAGVQVSVESALVTKHRPHPSSASHPPLFSLSLSDQFTYHPFLRCHCTVFLSLSVTLGLRPSLFPLPQAQIRGQREREGGREGGGVPAEEGRKALKRCAAAES